MFDWQNFIATLIGSFLAAGIASLIAMKIMLVRVETRVDGHDDDLKKVDARLDRLEGPFFQQRGR